MMFDARFPVPAREATAPAKVVAGDLVLAPVAVPDPVAAVGHRDAAVVQTSKLLRPTAEHLGKISRE